MYFQVLILLLAVKISNFGQVNGEFTPHQEVSTWKHT